MKRVTYVLPLFILAILLAASLCSLEAAPLKRPLSFQSITSKEGLSSEMVYAIAIRGDEVWFGTYGGGASRYSLFKNTWKAYTTKGDPPAKVDDGNTINWKNLLTYNHVAFILPDVDRIWFGTYFYGFGGGGISYYKPTRKPPWKRFTTNDGRAKKIVSMAVDTDLLWVGSEKGLSILDKKTEQWKAFYSTQQGLSGNFVNALLNQGDFLWAGTNGGISRIHKAKISWKTYRAGQGLTDGEIKSLAAVGDKIWAGAAEGTLFEYDPALDRWKRIESSDPLKNGGIQSMVASKERVFICRDNGVSVFDLSSGQWESLTTSDGLLSNSVFCVAEDKDSIWFGTDKGVSRLVLAP